MIKMRLSGSEEPLLTMVYYYQLALWSRIGANVA